MHKYFFEALSINQREDYRRETGISLYHIGLTQLYLGNYQQAVEFILKSLDHWEKMNDIANMWNCNELLGNIYVKLNDFEKNEQELIQHVFAPPDP